ncbi:MAG: PilZ domain-containing protein [Nitrospirota bacterium]
MKNSQKDKGRKDRNQQDKRKYDRKSGSETVRFSIIGSFSGQKELLPEASFSGTIVDMSESGLGLLTDIQLEPGTLVKLNEVKGSNVGVVMWTIDTGSKYRIGLKFV